MSIIIRFLKVLWNYVFLIPSVRIHENIVRNQIFKAFRKPQVIKDISSEKWGKN